MAQVQAQQLVAQPVAQVQAQPAYSLAGGAKLQVEQRAEEDNSHIVPFVEPASAIGWDLSSFSFQALGCPQ